MTALALDFPSYGYNTYSAQSHSAEGNCVAHMIQSVSKELLSSYALGNRTAALKTELTEIYNETRELGWDGDRAEPLEPMALERAFSFIDSLPADVPTPEMAPAPDGEIHFEWYFGPRKVMTVGISAVGELSFASMKGAKRLYGAEPFSGDFPEQLAFILASLNA